MPIEVDCSFRPPGDPPRPPLTGWISWKGLCALAGSAWAAKRLLRDFNLRPGPRRLFSRLHAIEAIEELRWKDHTGRPWSQRRQRGQTPGDQDKDRPAEFG
jgi:hypothetical protein